MRTFNLIFTAVTIVLLSSCQQEKDPLLDLVVLHDQTELMSQVTYADVRELLIYDDPRLLWYEVGIKTRGLSDVPHGVVAMNSLPKANSNYVTEQQRKAQFLEFLKQTEAMMSSTRHIEGDKSASHLYVGIVEELNLLAKSKATNRMLFVSSDLHENTPWFSVYDDEDREQLLRHPDSVVKRFESHFPLGDLTSVKVYLVHSATPETQEIFEAMSKLYTYMLSAKGAQVHTMSNLVFTQSIEP